MDSGIASSSSLVTRLSEPLTSTSELLGLLVPPLAALDLVPDLSPAFVARFLNPDSPNVDPTKFVKRQLGLVQKALVEHVWPDWEQAVEAEEGIEGTSVLERWFVPPPISAPTASSDGKLALSSYAVLSSFLSAKSVSTLQTRSLEIVSSLLVKLNSAFNLSELYLSTLGMSRSLPGTVDTNFDSDDEGHDQDDDRIDPACLAAWDHSTKDILGVALRVANAWGAVSEKIGARAGHGIPVELEFDHYASTLTSSYFSLLWSLTSPTSSSPAYPSALARPLKSLMTLPTFLPTMLPLVVPRIVPPTTFPTPAAELIRRQRYLDLVQATIAESPDRDLSRFLRTTLGKLSQDVKRSAPGGNSAVSAKAAAFVLASLFGPLSPASAVWKVAIEVLLDRNCTWDGDFVPKVVVCWLAGSEDAIVAILERVQRVWGSDAELKGGLDVRRTYLTSLLLVLVVSLPSTHPSIVSLSRSPLFLGAVSSSLSTVSLLFRLLGMLVAEYVSNRSVDPRSGIQALDFGSTIWDGEGSEKDKIREMRGMLKEVEDGLDTEGWKEHLCETYARIPDAKFDRGASRTAPKPRTRHKSRPVQPTSVEEPPPPPPKRPLISIIGSDDENGLEDEDELRSYPLPAGPSESTLEALSSSDPSLYQSAYSNPSSTSHPSQTRRRGKLRPPVYIFELTEYLRGKDPDGKSEGQKKEESDQEAERVEMALKEGEALIRRKAGWGNELKENAVNLAIALMSLQDNYELDDFETSRQNLLVALIVGCPADVAPCVIEQYFLPTYSISQLHTFLTALALAARELAGLPVPSRLAPASSPSPALPLFPSKRLPPALHRRLVGPEPRDQLQLLADDLTNLALSSARRDAETTHPEAAREKLLSVGRRSDSSRTSSPSLVAEKNQTVAGTKSRPTVPPYTSLSAEYFILPLLNRFWLYLRDAATLTLYTTNATTKTTTTKLPILEPLLVSKYLATVSILVDAARHGPTFLAVVAPETLQLVASLPRRHHQRQPLPPPPRRSSSRRPDDDDDDGEEQGEEEEDDPVRADQDLVEAHQLELVLTVVASSVDLDRGRTLVETVSFDVLTDLRDWAERVFEEQDESSGSSGSASMGPTRCQRAAAGVLLKLDEIFEMWRGRAPGWESI